MVLCSLTMAVGTSIGGYRIIKAVGMDMVKLENTRAFPADLGAAACLLVSSAWGIPVSTTYTKTTAIMGVGRPNAFLRQLGRGKGYGADLGADLPGLRADRFLMAKLFIAVF